MNTCRKEDSFDYTCDVNGESVSFHHNNDVRSDNIDLVLAECEDLKPYRINLFAHVVDFLKKIGVPYFISDGTALATFRDEGVMIPHDDDTDISVLEKYFLQVFESRHLLPDHVGLLAECEFSGQAWVRPDGTEVPFSGNGAKKFVFYDSRDFSHLKRSSEKYTFSVFTDMYTWTEKTPGFITNNYHTPASDLTTKLFPKGVLFPLKSYKFEGIDVTGPYNIRRYCEIMYGYLGRDAMWDADTELYVKRSTLSAPV